jgi:hypothetical protein
MALAANFAARYARAMPKSSTTKRDGKRTKPAKRPLEGKRLRAPNAKREKRERKRVIDLPPEAVEAVEPDASESEASEGDERAYPLFPKIAPGVIYRVTVLRYPPEITNGSRVPVPVAHPWDPWTCDKDRIAEVCGGGEYMVQAKDRFGRVVGALKFPLEGKALVPGIDDAKREGGLTIHETPEGGWTTIPGLAPEVNAIIVHSQQMAHNASTMEAKAIAGMAATLTALVNAVPEMMRTVTESARVPLARIEHLTSRLTAVETENGLLRAENTKLQIAKVKKEADGDDSFWKGLIEESKPLMMGAANKFGLLPNGNDTPTTQRAEVNVTGTARPEQGPPAPSGAGS